MDGTPIRRCVACRRHGPKPALVRLVMADGVIVVDPEARQPGRGAYLCGREECLDAALRRNAAQLRRALRTNALEVDEEYLRAAVRHGREEIIRAAVRHGRHKEVAAQVPSRE